MGKYGHELDLILLLTENRSYTALELANKLGITRRNLYNYFEYLRFSGFNLIKSGTTYRLDRSSTFFRKLHENIAIGRDEAIYLLRLLADKGKHDFYSENVRQKLSRQFNLTDMATPELLTLINRNTTLLKEAINRKCMCTLKDYSSPHSHTVSDRIVEPFLFMNDGLDIRCHEIRSHTNKTFKLARIGSIELLDVPWIAEAEHKQVFTDMFMFSGEQHYNIELRLGQLAHNLLVEEYPSAEAYISATGDGRWTFFAPVASFLGIGRFVLGLFHDIEIIGSREFREYVFGEVRRMQQIVDKQSDGQ